MVDVNQILAEIEEISSVNVCYINGVEMYEVTQLEKRFNYSVRRWMSQPYTRAYFNSLASVMFLQMNEGNIDNSRSYKMELLKIKESFAIQQGNRRWVCREVFIGFARWLSPFFAIKCDTFYAPLILDKQNKP